MYFDAKDYTNAYRVYSRLVDRFEGSYVGYYYLGKIYVEQEKYEEAEKAFQKTLELQPELEEPRSELINLYKKKGLEQKVVQIYKDILERDPGNPSANMELGYYYYKIGETDTAEALLKNLRRRRPM